MFQNNKFVFEKKFKPKSLNLEFKTPKINKSKEELCEDIESLINEPADKKITASDISKNEQAAVHESFYDSKYNGNDVQKNQSEIVYCNTSLNEISDRNVKRKLHSRLEDELKEDKFAFLNEDTCEDIPEESDMNENQFQNKDFAMENILKAPQFQKLDQKFEDSQRKKKHENPIADCGLLNSDNEKSKITGQIETSGYLDQNIVNNLTIKDQKDNSLNQKTQYTDKTSQNDKIFSPCSLKNTFSNAKNEKKVSFESNSLKEKKIDDVKFHVPDFNLQKDLTFKTPHEGLLNTNAHPNGNNEPELKDHNLFSNLPKMLIDLIADNERKTSQIKLLNEKLRLNAKFNIHEHSRSNEQLEKKLKRIQKRISKKQQISIKKQNEIFLSQFKLIQNCIQETKEDQKNNFNLLIREHKAQMKMDQELIQDHQNKTLSATITTSLDEFKKMISELHQNYKSINRNHSRIKSKNKQNNDHISGMTDKFNHLRNQFLEMNKLIAQIKNQFNQNNIESETNEIRKEYELILRTLQEKLRVKALPESTSSEKNKKNKNDSNRSSDNSDLWSVFENDQ